MFSGPWMKRPSSPLSAMLFRTRSSRPVYSSWVNARSLRIMSFS